MKNYSHLLNSLEPLDEQLRREVASIFGFFFFRWMLTEQLNDFEISHQDLLWTGPAEAPLARARVCLANSRLGILQVSLGLPLGATLLPYPFSLLSKKYAHLSGVTVRLEGIGSGLGDQFCAVVDKIENLANRVELLLLDWTSSTGSSRSVVVHVVRQQVVGVGFLNNIESLLGPQITLSVAPIRLDSYLGTRALLLPMRWISRVLPNPSPLSALLQMLESTHSEAQLSDPNFSCHSC